MGTFLTANIKYCGLVDKGLTYFLVDENKKNWVVWKKKKKDTDEDLDEDSEVWAALQNYKFGDTFGVSYQEKEEVFNDKQTGKLIKYMRKTIYSILPPVANPTATPKVAPKTITYEPAAEAKVRDFDKENVGKCQSLFLAAFIQSGKSFSEAILQAGQAKKLAEIVVYGHTKTEDTKVDDINQVVEL